MKIKNFQKNSANPKIFYLVSALRDGCLTTQWTIKIKQKNREWLSDVLMPMFTEVFQRTFVNNIYLQKEKTTVWYIAFKDKEIWKKLKKLSSQLPRTKEEQKFYIMGFWDTEGGCPKKPSINRKLYLKFTQKDKKSLLELKSMLENEFDIKSGDVRISEKVKNGLIWMFSITNKDGMMKFHNQIGSLHPEKKERLNLMKNLLLTR